MKTRVMYKQALIDTFKTLFFWLVSILAGWLLGKFFWAVLEILFSCLREPKIGDAFIDEVLFSTRIAFLGVVITSIIFLLLSFSRRADYKIDTNKLVTGGFLPYSLLLILTAYIINAWNGQSVYWLYVNPIPLAFNDIDSAFLSIVYNLIKAASIFCILVLEPWKYISFKSSISLSLRLFLGRLGSLIVIQLLCCWASIPNANLGSSATIVLAILAIIMVVLFFKRHRGSVNNEVGV